MAKSKGIQFIVLYPPKCSHDLLPLIGHLVVAGSIPGHSGHFGLFLGKTVYSILLQSTQLQNGYLWVAICCQLLWNIPRGIEMVSVCTVPARGGRSCERFGGYKTINRIPLAGLYTRKPFQSPGDIPEQLAAYSAQALSTALLMLGTHFAVG